MEGLFPFTQQGYWYYISFFEESTGLIDIEPLKFKDDVLAAFKSYKAFQEKQSDFQLKVFHTDGDGEYKDDFDDYLKEIGITHKVTAPYISEQNGKTERLNWTIMGPVWALLIHMKLSKLLWAEIAKAVVYLRNCSPIQQGIATAFKNLKGEKLYLGHFCILRCRVWVHIPKKKRKKLDDWSYQSIFVRYEGTDQYCVYDPQSGQISITRDVYFDKTHRYNKKNLIPEDFVNNKWHKTDNKLFADPSDILNTNTDIDEESTSELPITIPASVGDTKPTLKDQLRQKTEKWSCLQLNRRNRDLSI